MRARSRRLRIVLACLLFVVSMIGVSLPAPPVEAAARACAGPIIAVGRQRWCGYFKNIGWEPGTVVRPGGVPLYVDTAGEFIQLIEDDLNSGNAHRMTGAKFVVLTMLGRGPGAPQAVSPAELNDWEDRVRSYANFSENGSQSFGDNGRIDWKIWEDLPCNFVNTFYQVGQDDVAPYLNHAGNSHCNGSATDLMLLFRGTDGAVDYRIRRECLNPMGEIAAIEVAQPKEFSLTPTITPTINGAPIVGGAEVGQTIHFEYSVVNAGPNPSPDVNCQIYTNVHPGYFPTPNPATSSGGAGPPTGCPRVFPLGSSGLASEDVPIGAGNQTICRSLFVSPASLTVASLGQEVCVPVVNKPYFKVYGGDVSAGGGQTQAGGCTSNQKAAIIGWNKGGPGFGGASAQFAALALDAIFEVSTSQGNAVGAAAPPSGLAFTNTAPSGSVYGGTLGSLPCIPDYYAAKPASPMSFTTLAAATTSGAYAASGTVTLFGQLPAGKRVTLFVEGDVFITDNITYPANWTTADLPLLQVVARGNIYIRNTVSEIAGIFIAQPNGGSGGVIYTCATAAAPLVPGNSLHSTCNNKLTINGVFTAKQVQFLRTRGTVHPAAPNEASTSNNIAEVFNFSPAVWMAQPTELITGSVKYDSITSLPPIL